MLADQAAVTAIRTRLDNEEISAEEANRQANAIRIRYGYIEDRAGNVYIQTASQGAAAGQQVLLPEEWPQQAPQGVIQAAGNAAAVNIPADAWQYLTPDRPPSLSYDVTAPALQGYGDLTPPELRYDVQAPALQDYKDLTAPRITYDLQAPELAYTPRDAQTADLSGLRAQADALAGKEIPHLDKAPYQEYMDRWLQAAREQADNRIRYAVSTGAQEALRNQEDAQRQFEQQRAAIARDEALAREARQGGADLRAQVGYGTTSAVTAALIERLTGFTEFMSDAYGRGILNHAIEKAAGRLGKTHTGRMALAALGEGGEELI